VQRLPGDQDPGADTEPTHGSIIIIIIIISSSSLVTTSSYHSRPPRPPYRQTTGCKSSEFAENTEGNECSDYQEIKIQEQTQNLRMGSMPR
jgi:hypothetical protein